MGKLAFALGSGTCSVGNGRLGMRENDYAGKYLAEENSLGKGGLEVSQDVCALMRKDCEFINLYFNWSLHLHYHLNSSLQSYL